MFFLTQLNFFPTSRTLQIRKVIKLSKLDGLRSPGAKNIVKGIIKYLEQSFGEGQASRQFWKFYASVAELVYALALGASGAIHESSSLSARTTLYFNNTPVGEMKNDFQNLKLFY